MAETSGGVDETREHTADDYDGILDKTEAKKRVKHAKRENKEKSNPPGRPKGSYCLRTQLRKTGEKLRGNRPLFVLMCEAVYNAAISGDRDFNSAPCKLILEQLAGKPTQTIVADVQNRDGYADLSDEELLRIAGPLMPPKARKHVKARKKKGNDGGS